MAENKTKENDASVEDFLNKIPNENVRADCLKIADLMSKATDAKPKMWGDSIVGFGKRTMKYSTGRELEWLIIGFSPRKQNLTLYLNIGEGWNQDLLSQLGKHKAGMGCLYIKRLSDVDENVLEKLIKVSAEKAKSN
ncbi:MAG: DUF1801 domain-containing protein [Pyrinomonadaceae bacterium]